MPWDRSEISFDIVAEDSDAPIVTARIETPAGEIMAMAEASERGRILILKGLHMHGQGANAMGPANLRVLSDVIMEGMDYDAIEIEGATRTTGAGPGRRPGQIRFTRRHRAEGKA